MLTLGTYAVFTPSAHAKWSHPALSTLVKRQPHRWTEERGPSLGGRSIGPSHPTPHVDATGLQDSNPSWHVSPQHGFQLVSTELLRQAPPHSWTSSLCWCIPDGLKVPFPFGAQARIRSLVNCTCCDGWLCLTSRAFPFEIDKLTVPAGQGVGSHGPAGWIAHQGPRPRATGMSGSKSRTSAICLGPPRAGVAAGISGRAGPSLAFLCMSSVAGVSAMPWSQSAEPRRTPSGLDRWPWAWPSMPMAPCRGTCLERVAYTAS